MNSSWAASLKSEVQCILDKKEEEDLNPRVCYEFAARFLKELKTIHWWSCICRDSFGYGRVPPSSAVVESEFNIIKNHVIPKITRNTKSKLSSYKNVIEVILSVVVSKDGNFTSSDLIIFVPKLFKTSITSH